MTLENSQPANPAPASSADETPIVDIGNADASEGLTFDPEKYGLPSDFGAEGKFQDEEPAQEADLDDDVADEGEEPADDEPFILNDIDLSSIPKEFRKETLEETIKAIDEARKGKEDEATKSLEELQNITKQKSTSFVEQYHNNLKSLDAEIDVKFKEAKSFLQKEVDEGRMSEAEANFEYGKYKSDVKTIREKHMAKAYTDTNMAIVEDFIKNNEEALKNPTISEAAQIMLKDVLDDGNIVSTERSVAYLNVGKKLYDEGFKAGLASVKQTAENQKIEANKKKVSNPTNNKGVSTPTKRGNPYTSALDVPDKVWRENPEIRNFFLKKDLQDTFSLKS
jgi:hypothetical protein